MTKVKGSTLFEVLIATIISAVVVGIALSVWNIVFKEVTVFQKNYREVTAIQKLDQRLRVDFERAQTIRWDNLEELLTIEQSKDTIRYLFEGNTILRNDILLQDNFDQLTAFLEGTEQTSGIVDAVKIDLEKDNKKLTVFISRKLTAKEKMLQRNGH